MSEHDIADCPKCEKRDFVLKEDGTWICLNCGYSKKMPKSESKSNSDILSTLVAAFIVAMFMLVMLGG